MNTKVLAVAAGIVILLGIAGFMVMNQNKAIQTNTASDKKAENSTSSSLVDLLALGKDYRCTFTYDDGEVKTDGTVYIASGKIRNDFTTSSSTGPKETHIIRNGDDNYIWGGDMESGIKMTMKIEDVAANAQANQYVDLNAKHDYDCQAWSVDQSLFTPPSDIKFTDYSSFLPKTTGTQTTGSSPCDQLTDPTSKAACQKAFQQ